MQFSCVDLIYSWYTLMHVDACWSTKAMTSADVTAAGDAAVKAVVGEDRFASEL